MKDQHRPNQQDDPKHRGTNRPNDEKNTDMNRRDKPETPSPNNPKRDDEMNRPGRTQSPTEDWDRRSHDRPGRKFEDPDNPENPSYGDRDDEDIKDPEFPNPGYEDELPHRDQDRKNLHRKNGDPDSLEHRE